MVKKIDSRGLIFLSMPIHIEFPNNGGRLICELEDGVRDKDGKILIPGLHLVSKVAWYRDRHIVTTKSRRLTNTWEVIGIFSRQKNYHINREACTKVKKGFEGREGAFEEEEFTTCSGDHWPQRNDRRDRRFLPAGIVLNCANLADLQPNDRVLDPYGNPGIKDACLSLGWTYVDGGLPNPARNAKKTTESIDEDEDLSGNRRDEKSNCDSDQRTR